VNVARWANIPSLLARQAENRNLSKLGMMSESPHSKKGSHGWIASWMLDKTLMLRIRVLEQYRVERSTTSQG